MSLHHLSPYSRLNPFYLLLPVFLVDKPSQPGEIDVISVTKDCITIHWLRPEHDGGKEILGYWVEFRQAGESAWKKCNKERSKDRQFTMGGLMEASEYEFRVFAENETGLSRPRRTPMGIKTKLSGEPSRWHLCHILAADLQN